MTTSSKISQTSTASSARLQKTYLPSSVITVFKTTMAATSSLDSLFCRTSKASNSCLLGCLGPIELFSLLGLWYKWWLRLEISLGIMHWCWLVCIISRLRLKSNVKWLRCCCNVAVIRMWGIWRGWHRYTGWQSMVRRGCLNWWLGIKVLSIYPITKVCYP